MRLTNFAALFVLLVRLPSASAADQRGLDGFDDFMAKAMAEFKVPGAAVSRQGLWLSRGGAQVARYRDKPVREYLPAFRMYDPVATDQLTTRDMVTHRSGLPRHD